VTRDVRGVVSRLRNDLRFVAADRYREALARGSPNVRLFRAAAAGFDRLLDVKRVVADAPTSATDVVDSALALGRRLRRPDALLVGAAAIGGTDELSLSLSGPTRICAAVRGVSLVSADGRSPEGLETLVSCDGPTVRLVAILRPELFDPDGTTWRISVTDGRTQLPVVTATRGVIAQRWAVSVPWPPRIGLDDERRLTVTGQAPQVSGLVHAVSLGLTSAAVEWTALDGQPPELRVVSRVDHTTLVIAGHYGPDDTRLATVDLLALAARQDAVWDASVRCADEAWLPLELQPGKYPAMPTAFAVGAVTLRRDDGTRVPVRVGYTDRNRLRIKIGGRG
jgi:hypothetical protein